MFKNRLIYSVFLLCSILFYILYEDPFSLLILFAVLFLPLLLWILTLLGRKHSQVRLVFSSDMAEKGESVSCRIEAGVGKLFLASSGEVTLSLEELMYGERIKKKLCFPLTGGSFTAEMNLSLPHAGAVRVRAEKLSLYDAFGLFRRSWKIESEAVVSILPERHELPPESFEIPDSDGESDRFSEEVPGDDPSQVFDIREYGEGDRIRNIHWKLSSKQEKYMVKEYSQPLGNFGAILISLHAGLGPEITEGILETALSLSDKLLQQQTPFYLIWYDARSGGVREERIEEEDEFYGAWAQILSCGRSVEAVDFSDNLRRESDTPLFYITGEKPEDLFFSERTAVFCVVKEPKQESVERTVGGTDIFYLSAFDIGGSLKDLERQEGAE